MRLRRKSLQPKSAEEPSDVPALLIECQHVAVLSASRPVVWYVVGLVRPAKTLRNKQKGACRTHEGTASDILEEGGDDVQVRMAFMGWATHVLQWQLQWEARLRNKVAVGEPVAGLNPSRWKFPSRCLLPLVAGGRRVQRTRSRGRVIKSKNSIFLLVHQSEIKTNRALR
ncbi:hypothetical protein L1887_54174 [Cichorium endivia]|nr:hypothetical protein L1887_54174 [Cichorium endivia]